MSDSGTTTRTPVIIFVVSILVVSGLLAAMWVPARDGHLFPHTLGFIIYFLTFHVYLSYRVRKDATPKE